MLPNSTPEDADLLFRVGVQDFGGTATPRRVRPDEHPGAVTAGGVSLCLRTLALAAPTCRS
ncbi:MAG TPA: hypothetical protein VE781_03295, partial [Kineosporiaceae bacterium]|nr:hypothetical protein [Kineosporiaceae bacterium]